MAKTSKVEKIQEDLEFEKTKDEVVANIASSLAELYNRHEGAKEIIDSYYNNNEQLYNFNVLVCIKKNLIGILNKLNKAKILDLN